MNASQGISLLQNIAHFQGLFVSGSDTAPQCSMHYGLHLRGHAYVWKTAGIQLDYALCFLVLLSATPKAYNGNTLVA